MILKKEEMNRYLQEYYLKKYGEREDDIWFEQPAANVWIFKRGNNYITLQCHILNGVVTEFVDKG